MNMEHEDNYQAIQSGFQQAKLITRQCAKSFYFASHFLPAEKRNAAFAVYALCRISDDAVDLKQGRLPSVMLTELAQNIASAYASSPLGDNLLLGFRHTIKRYQIPKSYFDQLIDGIGMDLYKTHYRSFSELYDYCYKVAGVVGLIMLKIFGTQDPRAEGLAVDLGIAMQLTNILRDIKEDYAKRRIYLPAEEMRQFGVSEDDLARGNLSANFVSLIKFQIKRARGYYANSAQGISLITDKRCRFVVRAMKEIYSGILTAIENNNFDVFSQRAHVRTKQKIIIALEILLARDKR